ncbi:hypothetical protein ABIE67_007903 [Streptomyces sp. V4I8]|uniref:hypothetical protein n=1 Tax=Streptomyces sp. V4I8 TaxID=3156469 RepID=UPI003518E0E5
MTVLPEPPAAPAAGQAHIDDNARRLLAAVEEAMQTPTSYRDDTPVPRYGDTLPVQQPGRPAMSEKATDASVMMIAGGFLSLCLGAAISGVLYFSGTANETVVITVCAAPPVTFLALKSLIKGVKRAPEIHNHHYSGPVHQQHTETHSRSIWNKNTNQ